MTIRLKIFAGYHYQRLEEEFNTWSDLENPFVVKTILDTAPVPRNEQGFSLYFTLAIFYKQEGEYVPEVLRREGAKS